MLMRYYPNALLWFWCTISAILQLPTKAATYTNALLFIWNIKSTVPPTDAELTRQRTIKVETVEETEMRESSTINPLSYHYMVLNRYILTSWWLQMIYWVGALATDQTHTITLCITEVWYDFYKAKFKNIYNLVLNYYTAYAILNPMIATMKIVWEDATMGNVITSFTIKNSEYITPFGGNNRLLLLEKGMTDHICPH